MGLIENIFKKGKQEQMVRNYFKTLTAYQPVFTSFEGGVYEMALTRAAIHTFATHVSKLKPEVNGDKALEAKLQYKPNPYMDTTKFLYRLATIYAVNNNAFIAPLYGRDMETIMGYYPLLPQRCEVVEAMGKVYLRYSFQSGQHAAVEFERAGLLTQYQYKSDFFGETNRALLPMLELMHAQNQGIIEGVKNSATLRFIARLGSVLKDNTIEEERRRFVEDNFSPENNGGVLMFDAKYADVKQIDSKPYLVNPTQMNLINDSVYSYFGVNAKILQNDFSSSQWGSYYEGRIEPFAVQLGLVLTNMSFSELEVEAGNYILLSSNRLQYADNREKLEIVTQLFDRGFITHNQGLEIFNLPPVDGGDRLYIRREYMELGKENENAGEG